MSNNIIALCVFQSYQRSFEIAGSCTSIQNDIIIAFWYTSDCGHNKLCSLTGIDDRCIICAKFFLREAVIQAIHQEFETFV